MDERGRAVRAAASIRACLSAGVAIKSAKSSECGNGRAVTHASASQQSCRRGEWAWAGPLDRQLVRLNGEHIGASATLALAMLAGRTDNRELANG